MRAIDSNIIVRFLATDDPAQAERSRAVMVSGDVRVLNTVLLESEWVLRTAYRFTAQQIIDGLRSIVGLPGVSTEQSDVLERAFVWAEAGMDFSDALHLAQARDCDAFLSFDRRLAKRASACSPVPVREP